MVKMTAVTSCKYYTHMLSALLTTPVIITVLPEEELFKTDIRCPYLYLKKPILDYFKGILLPFMTNGHPYCQLLFP